MLAAAIGLTAAEELRALDPQTPLTGYARRNWNTHDGLPQGTVLDIAQTPEGYVWLATQEGLVRFDGSDFTLFDATNTPALRHSFVATLFVDRKGQLWIGTSEGLAILTAGRFRRIGVEDGLPGEFVTEIAEARDGSIWIGTEGQGVTRIVDGIVDRSTRMLPGLKITSIAPHPDGDVWAATPDAGAFRLQRGREPQMIAGLPSHRVRSLFLDDEDSLWIGTEEGVARMRRGERAAVRDARPALAKVIAARVLRDSTGALWVTTRNEGLIRVRGDRLERLGNDILHDTWVPSLLEDAQGNVWVGTFARGVVQLRDTPFTTLTGELGLQSDFVWSMMDADGVTWIGTDSGLAGIGRGRNVQYQIGTATPRSVAALAKRKQGGIWAGTFGGDIGYVDRGRFHQILAVDSLPSRFVYAIAEDADGALWIGTFSGLVRYRSGRVERFGAAQGFPDNSVRMVKITSDGALWAGTRTSGLYRRKDGRVTNYNTSLGLADNFIMSLIEDQAGAIWVTTANGISRIRNGKIESFSMKDGLLAQLTHSVVDDFRGSLWFTTNVGIYSVRRKDFDDYAAGRIPRLHPSVYGIEDGLADRECNGGGSPSSWRMPDGRLWFPTVAGIAVSNPRVPRRDESRRVIIEHTLFDGASFADHAEIAPGKKRLDVRFTAPEFRWPARIAYRYKLEGFDEEWSEASNRKRASYTNLPPGNYRFFVQARVGETSAWGPSAARTFRVAPHFYQTTWFRALCAAIIAGFVYWLHKLRMRLLEGRLSRKNEMILISAADGLVGVEADGTISFANRAAVSMLRLFEDPKGKAFHELVHPECVDAACPMSAPIDPHVPETTASFRCAGGGTLDVEFSRNAIRDEKETIVGAVFAFRDITERVAIERAKAELVSTVSHELRTPLTAIRGSLGLLGNDRLDADRRRRMIDIAISNSDRLLRLVNDILDAERLRTGNVSIALAQCEATAIMEAACENMSVLAAKANVQIRVAPLATKLTADPDRLLQTLTNLIANAIKFSPASGGTVAVGARLEESDVLFYVRDEGRGIPADRIHSIFERFQQVDATDHTVKGGAGLGLAICRSIVQQHGGRMFVESEVGRGSTFFFTIPRRAAESAA